ncbi:radical SAM protein [Nocardioides lijunqiniae]|uniref:radical SAM protein n=1 Tax=Nocardioides lijunqiniae TaxID=2760832 RepID=UPI0018784A27|nr:radical SAM protein [Nocardioides lijunqiniae]
MKIAKPSKPTIAAKPGQPAYSNLFVTSKPGKKLDCTLCYRLCTLEPGQKGPCGHRENADGRLRLTGHGEITCFIRDVIGFGGNPFASYKPNTPAVFIGGSRCTAACTFCSSGRAVHKPDALPKVTPTGEAPPHVAKYTEAGLGDLWYGPRGFLDPWFAVQSALAQGAMAITLGINEPLLTWEWSRDVARVAKENGLFVCVESNGFATTEAIEAIAPFVDAVDVGIKGSSDPEFYARRMRSPGGEVAALKAIETWARTDAHLIVGDLLAPPRMQDEAAFRESARRFYDHVLNVAGPVVDLLSTIILRPQATGGAVPGEPIVPLEQWPGVSDRMDEAEDLAHAAGLPFVRHYPRSLPCPCGADLLTNIDICKETLPRGQECRTMSGFCDRQRTLTNVTSDSKCVSCGRDVPVVPQTKAEQAEALRRIHNAVDDVFGDALPLGAALKLPDGVEQAERPVFPRSWTALSSTTGPHPASPGAST